MADNPSGPMINEFSVDTGFFEAVGALANNEPFLGFLVFTMFIMGIIVYRLFWHGGERSDKRQTIEWEYTDKLRSEIAHINEEHINTIMKINADHRAEIIRINEEHRKEVEGLKNQIAAYILQVLKLTDELVEARNLISELRASGLWRFDVKEKNGSGI